MWRRQQHLLKRRVEHSYGDGVVLTPVCPKKIGTVSDDVAPP
jgi:hypothetical protein